MAQDRLAQDGPGDAAGRIAVVTGGNRGIGFEICRQLAARGARVVLTARKPATGAAAIKKLAAQKLAAAFHPLDVTDDKSIASLHDFLQETFGHLDVLINNAGIIAKGEAPALKVGLPVSAPPWKPTRSDRCIWRKRSCRCSSAASPPAS